MKNTLSNVLTFTVGAAIGSAVTYYFVKKKYEQIAQNEIDSVKAEFAKSTYVGPNDADEAKVVEEDDAFEEEEEEEEPKHDFNQEYADMVQKLGYHNYSDVEPVNVRTDKNDISKESTSARVITPEEFGEEDYKIVELTYWADDVLTDAKNKRIQDVDGLIGKDTLKRFGEYEPDALHVRNDEKKIDFEIVRDLKRYSDFFDIESPHQAEDE